MRAVRQRCEVVAIRWPSAAQMCNPFDLDQRVFAVNARKKGSIIFKGIVPDPIVYRCPEMNAQRGTASIVQFEGEELGHGSRHTRTLPIRSVTILTRPVSCMPDLTAPWE